MTRLRGEKNHSRLERFELDDDDFYRMTSLRGRKITVGWKGSESMTMIFRGQRAFTGGKSQSVGEVRAR